MKRFLFSIVLFASLAAWAQGPNNSGTYYEAADGKCGTELKTALFNIISPHTILQYKDLGGLFPFTDKRDDGCVWDTYSNITNYSFTDNKANNCEGAGWNKEHTVPKSYFGGEVLPMYSDITHIMPTDAYINNMRSNYPFGETANPKKTSKNGFSKLGTCTTAGYTGMVFEPNDEYKGDFARIYFYMVTCYEDRQGSFTQSSGNTCFSGNAYPCFKDWFKDMLLRWANDDPVSEKEINRNNAVFALQGNRNPYVDYPGLEKYIWGDSMEKIFDYDNFGNDTPTTLKGDANGDGAIDVADITTIAAIILDIELSPAPNRSNADANSDGTIDVADITAVAAIILQ